MLISPQIERIYLSFAHCCSLSSTWLRVLPRRQPQPQPCLARILARPIQRLHRLLRLPHHLCRSLFPGPNAHIVSVNDAYSSTFRCISRVAPTFQGLQSTFLNLKNATDEEILGALWENTKLVWIESPMNPTRSVVDLGCHRAVVEGGKDDRAADRGADVVMGALILPEPTSSNQLEHAANLRFLQNAMGAVPSPFDCFLAQRSAKTLALRVKTHGLSALAVARTLQSLGDNGEGVDEVVYPGLPGCTEESRRKNTLGWRMLSPHARQWISESVYPDRGLESSDEPPAEGFPFSGMISVRLATHLLSPWVESLAEHPVAMTHGSISPAERELLGIGEDLVRLSVGVEEEEADLVADVRAAVGRS
ncbi:hypothetical protein D9619_011164 [Psilocybe cf. subviscida]|uniref:cystathionine gamma-lyase n=1 Tax=Psilocybe cf. subviscida TaxID=2480587 RepID=A0A8H5BKV5_9AGAR|nr:hypothetical protein D9619_011164 [Psilocybe cf. subviscida]